MTTNPRKNYNNNCNTKKVSPSYTQKDDSKTKSKRIRAKLQYFPKQVKEMHVREMIIPAHPAAAQRPFHFYDAKSSLSDENSAYQKRTKIITPPQVQVIYSKENLSNQKSQN
jgi:hypothetical protein